VGGFEFLTVMYLFCSSCKIRLHCLCDLFLVFIGVVFWGGLLGNYCLLEMCLPCCGNPVCI